MESFHHERGMGLAIPWMRMLIWTCILHFNWVSRLSQSCPTYERRCLLDFRITGGGSSERGSHLSGGLFIYHKNVLKVRLNWMRASHLWELETRLYARTLPPHCRVLLFWEAGVVCSHSGSLSKTHSLELFPSLCCIDKSFLVTLTQGLQCGQQQVGLNLDRSSHLVWLFSLSFSPCALDPRLSQSDTEHMGECSSWASVRIPGGAWINIWWSWPFYHSPRWGWKASLMSLCASSRGLLRQPRLARASGSCCCWVATCDVTCETRSTSLGGFDEKNNNKKKPQTFTFISSPPLQLGLILLRTSPNGAIRFVFACSLPHSMCANIEQHEKTCQVQNYNVSSWITREIFKVLEFLYIYIYNHSWRCGNMTAPSFPASAQQGRVGATDLCLAWENKTTAATNALVTQRLSFFY